MKKLVIGGVVLFTLGAGFVWAWEYFALEGLVNPPELRYSDQNTQSTEQLTESSSQPVPYTFEVVAENLDVPWSVVFTSPERILVTERAGTVRVIENGTLSEQPLHTFSEVPQTGEIGLMGMTLDPDYSTNKKIYVCYGYSQSDALYTKVTVLTDSGTALTNEEVLLDSIPAARFHAGCEVAFGPDGYMYITTGDGLEKQQAQDTNSLAGKILRIEADGSIPADNPFPNSPVFSYGHRNPQGIDWHPVTGELYSSEHGPSIFDGPAGGDELNRIEAGLNYGWPVVSHTDSQAGMKDPLLVFTPAVAPASVVFYDATVFPQWQNKLLFAGLRGETILVMTVDEANPDKIVSYQPIDGITFGRIRELAVGPGGSLYFTTSNTDNRGDVREGDDKLYRIIPDNT